jgi:hypothetical protein
MGYDHRYAVAELVEALCYKPEGRGSSPDEVIGFFSIDLILPAALFGIFGGGGRVVTA